MRGHQLGMLESDGWKSASCDPRRSEVDFELDPSHVPVPLTGAMPKLQEART